MATNITAWEQAIEDGNWYENYGISDILELLREVAGLREMANSRLHHYRVDL